MHPYVSLGLQSDLHVRRCVADGDGGRRVFQDGMSCHVSMLGILEGLGECATYEESAIFNDAMNLPTLTLKCTQNASMSPFMHDYPHVAREEGDWTVGVVKLAVTCRNSKTFGG